MGVVGFERPDGEIAFEFGSVGKVEVFEEFYFGDEEAIEQAVLADVLQVFCGHADAVLQCEPGAYLAVVPDIELGTKLFEFEAIVNAIAVGIGGVEAGVGYVLVLDAVEPHRVGRDGDTQVIIGL